MDLHPLLLSMKVATISTIIVFILGVFSAFLFAKREFYGKTLIESLFLVPLVLPPTVVGFGLLFLFGKNGWIGEWLLETFDIQIVFTWTAAVIASVVVSFPLMYQSASAAFENLDSQIANAARTMGASEWRVFRTITLPLAWPGLLAGLVMSFARGLGEFGATLMLAGYIPSETDTMPMAIYFAVEAGRMEEATFWVVLITVFGFSIITWLNWWSKRNLRKFAGTKR